VDGACDRDHFQDPDAGAVLRVEKPGQFRIHREAGMFTAYVTNKAGKITVCALPPRRREVDEAAVSMSKEPDVERVSVAAYGRVIAAFKDGARIE
jgi:hypothetical protein